MFIVKIFMINDHQMSAREGYEGQRGSGRKEKSGSGRRFIKNEKVKDRSMMRLAAEVCFETDIGTLMQEIVFLCHIVTETGLNSRYNW